MLAHWSLARSWCALMQVARAEACSFALAPAAPQPWRPAHHDHVQRTQSTERQIRRAGQISCVLQRAGCAAVASQQQHSQNLRKMAGITKAFSCRTAIAYQSPRTGLERESASLYSVPAQNPPTGPRSTDHRRARGKKTRLLVSSIL
jgi:hypothetical protein